MRREIIMRHRHAAFVIGTGAIVCFLAWVGLGTLVEHALSPAQIDIAAVTKISDLEVANKIQMINSTGPTIRAGTGDPNGSVTAPIGSLRMQTDSPALWINQNAGTTWNSTIAGTGTANTVAKFTAGTTVGNSSVTDNGTTFAINTNKFTVTEANGNTLIAGTTTSTGAVSLGDVNGDATYAISTNASDNTTVSGTLTVTPQTSGSVWFSGTAGLLSQDNSNFFWDNTNKRLGIGVAATPLVTVDLKNTTATEGVFQATLTSTSNNNATVIGINASASSGAMAIKNTNVNGPVDFYAQDNTGASKMSWGYGNTSYSDTARVGRAYLWRNTSVNFVVARTNIVDAFWDSSGHFGFGPNTSATAILEPNGTNPDIFINGSASGLLRFATNGAAAPSFTTRSAGAKIVLFPQVDGSNVDYGFGINAATLWSTIPQATSAFSYKWYGGTTNFASLDGTGQLSLTVTPAAAASDYLGILVNQVGTLNATAAQRISYGVKSVVTTTRSAGANNVINAALYGSVGSGQVNRALWTDDGDNYLTALSGTVGVRIAPDTTVQLFVDQPRSGQTTNWRTIKAQMTGSFDTTAGGLSPIAVFGTITATRSAGANNLTNTGGLFTATGGQVNIALQTNDGSIYLNTISGSAGIGVASGGTLSAKLHVVGDGLFTTNLSVNGNTTLGDANADLSTIFGHVLYNGTAPSKNAGCDGAGAATVTGTDSAFHSTTGAGATACTWTFSRTFTVAPSCTVFVEAGGAAPTCTISATAITCTVVVGATTYHWMCATSSGGT